MEFLYGLSSYFLWTQKGLTNLPLVRGSSFLVSFEQLNGFYKYHVVTAAHVSCPVRYKQVYGVDGDQSPLNAIGERHISNKLLLTDKLGCVVPHSLTFKQHFMPNVDVSLLRLEREAKVEKYFQPLEVDTSPLRDGEEIVLYGMKAEEESGNPNDDGLKLIPLQYEAVCKAALVSLDYGTVFLGAVHELMDKEDEFIPSSMCGGPVVRKSNGKVVGVIVSRPTRTLPLQDRTKPINYSEPFLQVEDNAGVLDRWPLHVAFVPFTEFNGAMRRSES